MQIEQWTRYRAKDHRRLEAVVSSFTLPILRRYLRDIDSTANFYEIFTRKRNKLDPIRSRNVYEKRLSNRNVIRDKDIRLNSYPIDYGIDTLVEKKYEQLSLPRTLQPQFTSLFSTFHTRTNDRIAWNRPLAFLSRLKKERNCMHFAPRYLNPPIHLFHTKIFAERSEQLRGREERKKEIYIYI